MEYSLENIRVMLRAGKTLVTERDSGDYIWTSHRHKWQSVHSVSCHFQASLFLGDEGWGEIKFIASSPTWSVAHHVSNDEGEFREIIENFLHMSKGGRTSVALTLIDAFPNWDVAFPRRSTKKMIELLDEICKKIKVLR